MSKYEPNIKTFFHILKQEDVTGACRQHPEFINDILYYTEPEQFESVENELKALSTEDKQKVMKGLGCFLPFTLDLVKHLFSKLLETSASVNITYSWLKDFSATIKNYVKELRNTVDTVPKVLSDRIEENEKLLAAVQNELLKNKEQLKQFADIQAEISQTQQEIDELKKQQSEQYWEDQKQKAEVIRIKLMRAKAQYRQDCKDLLELPKELEKYESGEADKNVANLLKVLKQLAEKLKKDGVN